MALNKAQLQQTIESLLSDLSAMEENPGQARNDFASSLATAIEAFVKTGQINVTVTTTGTATSHTGTGTGTIS